MNDYIVLEITDVRDTSGSQVHDLTMANYRLLSYPESINTKLDYFLANSTDQLECYLEANRNQNYTADCDFYEKSLNCVNFTYMEHSNFTYISTKETYSLWLIIDNTLYPLQGAYEPFDVMLQIVERRSF